MPLYILAQLSLIKNNSKTKRNKTKRTTTTKNNSKKVQWERNLCRFALSSTNDGELNAVSFKKETRNENYR